ncbi:MAG: hypothetical protein B6D61_07610, partial [Bacteroidetes bacterium 4484_249]
MKRIILSLIKQLIFWMLVFASFRAAFIIYYFNSIKAEGAGFSDATASFWHALPLDIATACYFLLFPFLILFIQTLYSPKLLNYINY